VQKTDEEGNIVEVISEGEENDDDDAEDGIQIEQVKETKKTANAKKVTTKKK
jgi:hypothetical protein